MRLIGLHSALGLLFAALSVGCGRPNEASAPPASASAAPEGAALLLPATGAVVRVQELPRRPAARVVRADFNLDQLEDLAIAAGEDGTDSEITVYLRKEGGDIEAQYYRAGGIRQAKPCAISALMSRKGPDYTDLIVILNPVGGGKEMVHYSSDGKRFVELERKTISSAGGVSNSAAPPLPAAR